MVLVRCYLIAIHGHIIICVSVPSERGEDELYYRKVVHLIDRSNASVAFIGVRNFLHLLNWNTVKDDGYLEFEVLLEKEVSNLGEFLKILDCYFTLSPYPNQASGWVKDALQDPFTQG